MNFWTAILLIFVFGFLFRLGSRTSRIGWLIWLIPLVLYAILPIGQFTEADAFLRFAILIFALGGLLCGLAIQFHKFFAARR